jgi:hypothetical protein
LVDYRLVYDWISAMLPVGVKLQSLAAVSAAVSLFQSGMDEGLQLRLLHSGVQVLLKEPDSIACQRLSHWHMQVLCNKTGQSLAIAASPSCMAATPAAPSERSLALAVDRETNGLVG